MQYVVIKTHIQEIKTQYKKIKTRYKIFKTSIQKVKNTVKVFKNTDLEVSILFENQDVRIAKVRLKYIQRTFYYLVHDHH